MSLRRVVPALAAVALVCPVAPAAAHAGKEHRHGGAVVSPIDRLGGLTGAEALARSFERPYENPPPDPYWCVPFAAGVVELLVPPEGGELDCTITQGTRIAVFPGASCSTAEPPPWFGRDEAEQRACARAAVAEFGGLTLTIDGGPPIELLSDAFALESDQFAVDVIPGNEFEAEPGPATAVAVGWGAAIKLRPGRHTLELVPTGGDDPPPPATVTVDVRPCGHHHH